MRLLDHQEASQLPLEKVQDQVKTRLIEENARKATTRAGEEAVKQLQAGTVGNDIAGKLTVAWKDSVTIDRTAKDKDIDTAIVKKAFSMTKPSQGTPSYDGVALSNGDYAIIALSKVNDGDSATVDQAERDDIKRQLMNAAAANSQEYLLATLRRGAKVVIQEEDL